jgi:hypothetical protein
MVSRRHLNNEGLLVHIRAVGGQARHLPPRMRPRRSTPALQSPSFAARTIMPAFTTCFIATCLTAIAILNFQHLFC